MNQPEEGSTLISRARLRSLYNSLRATSIYLRVSAFTLLLIALGAGSFLLAQTVTNGGDRASAGYPPVDQLDIRADGPDFSGKTLHWREEATVVMQDSPDPANGKPISTDIWVRMGSLNSPVAVRSVATFQDGSIYQAQLLLEDQGILLFGESALALDLPGEDSCSVTLPGSSSVANMEGIRPFYVDFARAASVGLQSVDRSLMERPSLKAEDARLGAQATLDGTSQRVLTADFLQDDVEVSVTQNVDTDTGLLAGEQITVRSEDGSILSQQQRAVSAIQVFDNGTEPAGVFEKASLPGVTCE